MGRLIVGGDASGLVSLSLAAAATFPRAEVGAGVTEGAGVSLPVIKLLLPKSGISELKRRDRIRGDRPGEAWTEELRAFLRGENTSSDLTLEEERGRFEEVAGLGMDIACLLAPLFVFIVYVFEFNGGVNPNDTEGRGAHSGRRRIAAMDEWVDAADEWVFGRVQLTNGFCVGKR